MKTATNSNAMPTIDLNSIDLDSNEREIASRILNGGKLRASKPAIAYTLGIGKHGQSIRNPDEIGGKAAYVWRMVAFTISPVAKHHCMPTTADFDLPRNDYNERRQLAKELDVLVDKIIKSAPLCQHYGTMRWGRAFGMIGR